MKPDDSKVTDLHDYKVTHPDGRVEYKGDVTPEEWAASTWQAKLIYVLAWVIGVAVLAIIALTAGHFVKGLFTGH